MSPSLFRSEEVSLVQLYLPTESARPIMSALGELSTIHFKDLNPDVVAFQRSFVREIRRLTDTERLLRYLHSEIDLNGIHVPDHNLPPSYESVLESSTIEDIIERITRLEARVRQLVESSQLLEARYLQQLEFANVLTKADAFFSKSGNTVDPLRNNYETSSIFSGEDDTTAPLIENALELGTTGTFDSEETSPQMNTTLDFVSGIIPTVKFQFLERILWRTLRGNLFIHQVRADDSLIHGAEKNEEKTIFLVIAHGTQILLRIRKISESLGATLFPVEEDAPGRTSQIQQANVSISDLNAVLENTRSALYTELTFIAEHISAWEAVLHKDKTVFQVMNLFNYDQNHKCLIAEGWCPTANLPMVQKTLRNISDLTDSQAPTILNVVHTSEQPPTYFRVNKFTEGFQSIIDSYGIATYREVNHGIVAIVTFPFLFAIMFGDLGHGAIMASVALMFVLYEKTLGAKKDLDEIVGMVFYGRYIVLLMGLFSMYVGFVYNDLFSKPMSIFSSRWVWPVKSEEAIARAVQVGTYPIGIDPTWHSADNNLLFMNSYKMKLSIILGVIHMTFCLFLSLSNYRFFKRKLDIYAVFVPSLIFLEAIFGYLVITIVYKWCIDWKAKDLQPPSLLNMLILMFLSPGTLEDQLYPGQKYLQVGLVIAALICVPWLLIVKPFVLWRRHSNEENKYQSLNSDLPNVDEADALMAVDSQEKQAEPFELGEVVIHQVIHTIEFCLGCVSHTASYLRLWALSLAHNQLSSVLWNMTLANGFRMTGIVGSIFVVILFGFWFIATCVVLVAMEGTSAMLHSLRLHWVEGMSKHFEGEGYAFTPFTFKVTAE
ncbi:V-type ATPase V0 subunit a [Schizosaccharomyces pombe]|uniref:V-type proton ATPase subunit a n=1 Tax=Schizosaccharomyces pombe (strain 972 / ATCC 24843) TaxID=284812 RepID=VPP1_SCHPO|nr:putative V-type ATPase V0 subunit a [Schizosaccharomyces pombe]O13742.2 RecName: Full=V-type proton ATPase subunit a; Short=V-ATPase a subunit; AltName: Full=Vacuolar ATPase 91 kDa subunit; AltName: Full=Vacuolar proton pump a subunit; AltName: Full=Vacuolar proton translocating ATPase subunit a [Schizosaccharomyces pombe 972h-]CAB11035.2 V-type ATPase V0 subunit a (predicted) [Schizosaccharomyces pombe]|eukprot:NP_594219.2 putative V-type ATPase V0 subunit a [Schizosaccharomyces pombe]